MARLSLSQSPTFKATVLIPVRGGKPAPVEFTFRGRNRDEYEAFVSNLSGRGDAELVLEVACGWDLIEEFSPENVARLCNEFLGAGTAILRKYIEEHTGARLGN